MLIHSGYLSEQAAWAGLYDWLKQYELAPDDITHQRVEYDTEWGNGAYKFYLFWEKRI